MRVAELSARSGVPVPTIKYYLREGLLPSGTLTSPNQAQYGEAHVRRLRLIRALVDVGGLTVAATREVLAAIDSPDVGLHKTLGKAQFATTPRRRDEAGDAALAEAARAVDDLIRRRGWQVKPENPARRLLADVIATLQALGQHDLLELLDDYAAAAERLAESEVATVLARSDVDSIVEGVVIGTLLGDALMAAMRRLAQADASSRLSEARATQRAASTRRRREAAIPPRARRRRA